MKISHIVAFALGIVFLLLIVRLDHLENGGPAHQDVMLPGGEPGTFYLPGAGQPFYQQFPKPVAERPAAVVLVHGFSADRAVMSELARRITQNGYAVLAIDVRGHGENRNPFDQGEMDSTGLRHDIQQAVDFLRASDYVDGSRLVVMGHSMGSGATLDYATHDPNLKGSVMISGGWVLGPERPKNALFIFAAGDPEEGIQDTSIGLATHLAGVDQIDLGKVYGDFEQGNAVEAIRIPGVNHVTILSSPEAATTIIKWLDSSFGTTRNGEINLRDPRRGTARFALIVFFLLLIPIGRICGAMAPSWPEERPGPAGWVGLLIVGGALLAAMPLTATDPAAFVPVVVGDIQISWFLVAGMILIGVVALRRFADLQHIAVGAGIAAMLGAAGFAAAYVGQVAMSSLLHHLSLSPERAIVMIVGSALIFPFWMGFELLVRRGGVAISTMWAILGRLLIVIMMAVGVALHVLPFVLMLVLPILALGFVLMEVFAASAYSTSRNLVLIAVAESLWFAWMIAATNPITFMF